MGSTSDGYKTLEEILGEYEPDTLTVKTTSGGMHIYFKETGRFHVKGSTKINGIDLRPSGNYVVGAGSTIDGISYEVINDSPIAIIPEWLEDKLIELIGGNKSNNQVQKLTLVSDRPRLKPKPVPVGQEFDLNRINSVLPYEDWTEVIWAYLNTHGYTEKSIEELRLWSSAYPDFDEKEFTTKIETYDPDHANPVGRARLERAAMEYPSYTVAGMPTVSDSNLLRANALRDKSFNILISNLEKYGNIPDHTHKYDLYKLSTLLAYGAFSEEGFKTAFPLGTGMGKTQSIVALMLSIIELGYDDISLSFAAMSINELKSIYNSALDSGVPPEYIGALFSGNNRGDFSSIAKDDCSRYQFLLVTHSRYSVASYSHHISIFNRKKRSLVIWDEAFLSTEGIKINPIALMQECYRASLICKQHIAKDDSEVDPKNWTVA